MVAAARELRRLPTPSEALLWPALRAKAIGGVRFRRQQNIGTFVVDFYAATARLVVEVDGPVHESQRQADRERQDLLESLGLRFLRVSSEDVERDLDSVLDRIKEALGSLIPNPSPTRGEGDQTEDSPSPLVGEGAGG